MESDPPKNIWKAITPLPRKHTHRHNHTKFWHTISSSSWIPKALELEILVSYRTFTSNQSLSFTVKEKILVENYSKHLHGQMRPHLVLNTWWPSAVTSLTTGLHLIPNDRWRARLCLLALLQPWNRFSKTQECESLSGWLSCFHSRNGHGIMHSSPREERVLHTNLEKARSQIPHRGVFSDTGITLMTSWQNFCNQSRTLKYSKTQNLVLLLTDLTHWKKSHHRFDKSDAQFCCLTKILRVLSIAVKFRCLGVCLLVNRGY